MQRIKNKPQFRAQSFTEYATIIGLAAAVLIGMRVFMVRSVQEKFRQAADVFGQGEQYAKGVTRVTDSSSSTIPTPSANLPQTNPCSQVVANVGALETGIANLNSQAGSLEQAAVDFATQVLRLEAQIPVLRAQAGQMRSLSSQRREQSNAKQAQAVGKRREEADKRAQADTKQAEADEHRNNYPYCFRGDDDGCSGIIRMVRELEDEAGVLRQEADELGTQAGKLETDAADLNNQADSLQQAAANTERAAADLETQIPQLQAQAQQQSSQAASLRAQVGAKQAEASQLRSNNPACFPQG